MASTSSSSSSDRAIQASAIGIAMYEPTSRGRAQHAASAGSPSSSILMNLGLNGGCGGGEPAFDDPGGDLGPRAKSELGQNAPHMRRDRGRAQIEGPGDTGLGKSHRQQVGHLLLARAQAMGRASAV